MASYAVFFFSLNCLAAAEADRDQNKDYLYSDQFVLHVEGGPSSAHELARKHGFIYLGQVSTDRTLSFVRLKHSSLLE